MDKLDFNIVMDDLLFIAKRKMERRAREYSDDSDRLRNFKTAAELRHQTLYQAIAGPMSKHTVSIYDMIDSPESYTVDVWEEKIVDHINYLILLRAAIAEEQEYQKLSLKTTET